MSVKKRGTRRTLLLSVFLLLSGVAVATAGVFCFEDVDIYYPDGSVEHCSVYCTLTGGYVKSGCTQIERPLQ